MKYKKLVEKAEKLDTSLTEGKQVIPAKLEKLQQLLSDKRARYKRKLAAAARPEKQQKWGTRLKVVSAQLEKLRQLAAGD